MRYIILFITALFIGACEERYEVNIKYQDGTQETIYVKSHTYPLLDDGCIEFTQDDAIRCGVKSFTYKIIESESD